MEKKYTILETFVGAGGAHLGFKNEGFVSKYANDIELSTLETLLLNNPEISDTAFIDHRDILKIKGEEILENTNLLPGEADVFFSGIVCKGFSLADKDHLMMKETIFIIKQLELINIVRPKISILKMYLELLMHRY